MDKHCCVELKLQSHCSLTMDLEHSERRLHRPWRTHQPQYGSFSVKHDSQSKYCEHSNMGTFTTIDWVMTYRCCCDWSKSRSPLTMLFKWMIREAYALASPIAPKYTLCSWPLLSPRKAMVWPSSTFTATAVRRASGFSRMGAVSRGTRLAIGLGVWSEPQGYASKVSAGSWTQLELTSYSIYATSNPFSDFPSFV